MGNSDITSKQHTILKVVRDWVSPIMAVIGWLLLIIFYLMIIVWPGGEAENQPPIIHDILVDPKTIQTGQTASVKVIASDPNGDELHYIWSSYHDSIQSTRFQDDWCTYLAPDLPQVDVIMVTVYDDAGAADEGYEFINIVEGGTD